MNGKRAKKLRKKLRKVIEQHPEKEGLFKFYMRKAKKAMLCLPIIFVCLTAYSDTIIIPFDCYPKELQNKFSERGYKLDLSANDRTKESWAFLDSQGSTFTIYTYRSTTSEEFNIIKEIVFER